MIRILCAVALIIFIPLGAIGGCNGEGGGKEQGNCCEFIDSCEEGTDVRFDRCTVLSGLFVPDATCGEDDSCVLIATPTPTPTATATRMSAPVDCDNLAALGDPAFDDITAFFLDPDFEGQGPLLSGLTTSSVFISGEFFGFMGTLTGDVLGPTTFNLSTLDCDIEGVCPLDVECCGECSLIDGNLVAVIGQLGECEDVFVTFDGQCESVESSERTELLPEILRDRMLELGIEPKEQAE